jgi:hypothetical protein
MTVEWLARRPLGTPALSEVNVEMLSEGISLFWSALRYVTISQTQDQFTVCEQALLFWEGSGRLIPFETTALAFADDGTYTMKKSLVFTPSTVSASSIDAMLAADERFLRSLREPGQHLPIDHGRLETFPTELLIAAVNGSATARGYLENYLDGHSDGAVAEARTKAISLLRRLDVSGG